MAKKQSIWARIFGIGKANANAAIDALEDPKKMLDQTVRDYTNNIAEAEQAVAQTIGNLRMAEEDLAKAQNEANEWGSKALAASNKAEEFAASGDAANQQKFNQLATVAIQRQMAAEKKAGALASTVGTQREVVDKLKTGLNTMQTKRQELVSKRDELVARARNAKTQNQMMDTIKALDINDPSSEISRFEQKIRQDEAKVRGAAELAASSLDSQFAQLEDLGAATEVEARLAALKAANAPAAEILEESDGAAQLEAAAPEMSEIEARLAAMKKNQA
ncbi:PspA/IM30 family protein [Glutamicibacter protophormiae]|uniref:Phage shock protein A n=1 Tax=Glutamicibacter protophormiae TaxID=37930 RepID=A0ABS4XLV3_GLUPR|nr:PspA/IM30 family protein [Glutamicibacter protophormiae]MBP2397484.1 phage shock protein A [Glutamicibacter protophormiae]